MCGHGVIDISRFWRYLNDAVPLQGIIGMNFGFWGQIWVLGGKETGFLRQFGHQNRDLIKKPGFSKPTGEFWGLGGHGAIDISRFWRYIYDAVPLRVLHLG